MALVLASASPRRRELLAQFGLTFQIDPAQGEELMDPAWSPEETAAHLAEQKARETAARHPRDAVIGADTIVVLGDTVLGKPWDKAHAARMLQMLSGKTHQVMTGVCVMVNGQAHGFVQKTDVTFYPLSQRDIDWYTATGEPLDKAGAYGIQGLGMALVEGIRGDYANVVGLPVARLLRLLQELEQL